uniref:acyltransferase n=1 Tax=Aliarcobacter sp. TaxID=2321116 RepID=UPI0040481A4D
MKLTNLLIYPLFFIFNHLSFRVILPKKIRRRIDFIRTRLIMLMRSKVGENVYFSKNFFTTNFENLSFGNNGTIGMNCEFYSYDKITIGDNFLIGSNVVIHTAEHIFSDSTKPIIEQGSIYKPVFIGDNVYLGSGVTILSGVKIDDNVIVGSGGVVTKDLESGWIYGGNPVKRIKRLYSEE